MGGRAIALGIATGLLFRSTVATAEPASPESQPSEFERECVDSGNKEHVVGAILDVGGRTDSAGIRYLHSHLSGTACGGLGAFGWLSYGAETRVTFFPAVASYAVGRAGVLGDGGGFSTELGFGGGTDLNKTSALGFLALFWSGYVFDLGGIGHFPLGGDRPNWLGTVQFAMRVHVPVYRYDRYEKREERQE
jgi:hypothetical protein